MIFKLIVFILLIVNCIGLYFYLDGIYLNPGMKTMSTNDLIYFVAIDMAFILFYLIRKNTQKGH